MNSQKNKNVGEGKKNGGDFTLKSKTGREYQQIQDGLFPVYWTFIGLKQG